MNALLQRCGSAFDISFMENMNRSDAVILPYQVVPLLMAYQININMQLIRKDERVTPTDQNRKRTTAEMKESRVIEEEPRRML